MKKFILGLTVAALSGVASHAGLIGSSVTGNLVTSSTGSANQFTTTTAAVSSSTEFKYSLGSLGTFGSVDISDNQITLNVLTLLLSPTLTITLTDASFAGLTLKETADNFGSGANAVLSGSKITITVPAFVKMGSSSATYSLTSGSTRVPDGGSSLAMLLGGVGLLAAGRIRKNS